MLSNKRKQKSNKKFITIATEWHFACVWCPMLETWIANMTSITTNGRSTKPPFVILEYFFFLLKSLNTVNDSIILVHAVPHSKLTYGLESGFRSWFELTWDWLTWDVEKFQISEGANRFLGQISFALKLIFKKRQQPRDAKVSERSKQMRIVNGFWTGAGEAI